MKTNLSIPIFLYVAVMLHVCPQHRGLWVFVQASTNQIVVGDVGILKHEATRRAVPVGLESLALVWPYGNRKINSHGIGLQSSRRPGRLGCIRYMGV